MLRTEQAHTPVRVNGILGVLSVFQCFKPSCAAGYFPYDPGMSIVVNALYLLCSWIKYDGGCRRMGTEGDMQYLWSYENVVERAG